MAGPDWILQVRVPHERLDVWRGGRVQAGEVNVLEERMTLETGVGPGTVPRTQSLTRSDHQQLLHQIPGNGVEAVMETVFQVLNLK